MKKLEEIKKHLLRFGYTNDDKYRICGWLVAKGIKDINETLIFREGTHTIEDFIGWFENGNADNKPFTCKRGDFVSVQRGIHGIALADSKDGLILLLDENCVLIYAINEDTRLCTEEEKECILDYLKCQGITYNEKEMTFGIDDKHYDVISNLEGNNKEDEFVSFYQILEDLGLR